ncbi:MAG: hypothetical protein ACYC6Y_25235 [Thermoguttaceae bacterium]
MEQNNNTLIILLLALILPHPAAGAEPRGRYVGPAALAAAPDGATLYAACADSHEVAWVDAGWPSAPMAPNCS